MSRRCFIRYGLKTKGRLNLFSLCQWLEQAPPTVITFASWAGGGNGWLPLELGSLPAPGFLGLSLNVLIWLLRHLILLRESQSN